MLDSQPFLTEVTCAPSISDGQARIRRASLVRGQSIREKLSKWPKVSIIIAVDREYEVIDSG